MNNAIKNYTTLVLWKPGSWKSMLACLVAWEYYVQQKRKRIFSNLEIIKNWKKINNTIEGIEDIERIQYNEEKGLAIFEEWWINFWARNSMSNTNKKGMEFWALSRKANVDIIIISQFDFMVDKFFRNLADKVIEMESYIQKKHDKKSWEVINYPFFRANYLKFDWAKKKYIRTSEVDLMKWISLLWLEYNTLEKSKFT